MNKVSILAVVPNEGLRNAMREIAMQWKGIRLQIYMGRRADIAKVAGAICGQYEIVISRGDLADLLRQACSVPVIDMGISSFDMLTTIMLAQSGGGRAAIVGLPAVAERAEKVRQAFRYDVAVYSVNTEQELRARLTALKSENQWLVIGDVQVCEAAAEMGMDTVPISCGSETIENAFQRAAETNAASRACNIRLEMLEHVLGNIDQVVLVFSSDGELVFSSGDAPSAMEIHSELQNKHGLWELGEDEPCLENMGNSLWLVKRKSLNLEDGSYTAFHCRSFPAFPVGTRKGISILTELDQEQIAIEAYMEHSVIMSPVLKLARRYSKFNFPVVLIGERGVGKDTLAYIVKNHSKHKFAATIMIDCILIDEENWFGMLNDVNSVLFQSNVMYYYRNYELLSPLLKEKIVKHISRMKTQDKSFHIIAINTDSTVNEANYLLPSSLNTLQCNTLFIPSLRERQSDIASLATLYVNQFSNKIGTQTARIEPKAISLLKSFPWPGNLYQFRRIITELLSMKDSLLITEADVRYALQQEQNSMVISNTNTVINMDGTLEDIEKRIIYQILREENMNQTRAAARLGISRVSLWRKLKDGA